MVTDSMVTTAMGAPLRSGDPAASIFLITSTLSGVACPNSEYWGWSWAPVSPLTMKNWLPLVLGPELAMAMANAGPDTNGSQFFIVSGQSGVRLPPQYSLFGKVVKGLDVLAQMEAVETDRADKPHADISIQSVTVTESD